ncbi:hypothetical protein GGP41_004084 [Bipolaris sorokiniana]|uniref:Uncharacterized protein n=1 Tax=Cochliobolus sativus TaxID=45130 RepID=A0A8H6DYI5_COCSA|nr:hypothetical protein GGP41_004084 [Bipolaris sorokiniana]
MTVRDAIGGDACTVKNAHHVRAKIRKKERDSSQHQGPIVRNQNKIDAQCAISLRPKASKQDVEDTSITHNPVVEHREREIWIILTRSNAMQSPLSIAGPLAGNEQSNLSAAPSKGPTKPTVDDSGGRKPTPIDFPLASSLGPAIKQWVRTPAPAHLKRRSMV